MKVFAVTTTVSLLALAAQDLAAQSIDPIAHIQQELAAGNKTIVVPPGLYRLTPEDDVYLKLRDVEGVTIDLTGVEFLGMVDTRMVEVVNCVDVTLKGLTIDYDPLPFTQARIIEVDEEKNWTVQVIEGYPTEGIGNGDACWPIQAYGKDSLELVNPMRFRDGIDVTRVDGNTFRITGGQDRRGEVGDIAVWTCSNCRDEKTGRRVGQDRTVFSEECVNLRFEDFTIYSTRGIAFWEYGNAKTVYQNCRIDRRPPETDYVQRGLKRLRSGNHDAFHSRFATVGPQIIGCTARYHCDDCVNVTGLYSIVIQAEGDELRILAVSGGKWLPQPGESIQIMTYDGQCPPDAKVLAVTPAGEWTDDELAYVKELPLWPGIYSMFRTAFTLKIDRDAGLKRGDIVIANSRCGNGFLVKGCDFGHVRARGIITKASHGAIEDNTITACASLGMWIAPNYLWMEGGCSSDLRITGNRLLGNQGGGIAISGVPGTKVALPANSHRDIVITGNTFSGPGKAIQVTGCTNLQISGNTLETDAATLEDTIILKNVADVVQEDNIVTTVNTTQMSDKGGTSMAVRPEIIGVEQGAIQNAGSGAEIWRGGPSNGNAELVNYAARVSDYSVNSMIRIRWCDYEEREGEYHFGALDQHFAYCLQYGQRLNVACFLTSSNAGNMIDGALCAYPEYVHAALQASEQKDTKYTYSDGKTTRWEPNFENTYFFERYDALLAAFAEYLEGFQEYEGKRVRRRDLVRYIELRHFGWWGEGAYPKVLVPPNSECLIRFADAFVKHFPSIRLLAPTNGMVYIPSVYGTIRDYHFHLLTAKNEAGLFGIFRDNWGWDENLSYVQKLYYASNEYERDGVKLYELLRDRWKLAPLVGEPLQAAPKEGFRPYSHLLDQVTYLHPVVIRNCNVSGGAGKSFTNPTTYSAFDDPQAMDNFHRMYAVIGFRYLFTGA
ncbi:MAG: right-handed parallel beta-helix repeat-containing protein, partial [Lentisphaeria bacterium]|nr:right-handed parallel beta-helix repeat-containing protein [Lentisphaeria bacterium]